MLIDTILRIAAKPLISRIISKPSIPGATTKPLTPRLISFRLKQLLALILILTLTTPIATFAAESSSHGIHSQNAQGLPGQHTIQPIQPIQPLDSNYDHPFDIPDYHEIRLQSLLARMDDFDFFTAEEQWMVREYLGLDNLDPLVEPSAEELEEFLRLQEEKSSIDSHTRELMEFTRILNESLINGLAYSELPGDDQNLILRHLDITYDLIPATKELFLWQSKTASI